MSDLRIGLVGTGRIGQVHAENIAALPGVALTKIADIDSASAHSTADNFGASACQPEEIFSSPDVDAVVVASPTMTHVDMIMAAVRAELPVLCEKPIDLDIARVNEVREAVNSSGVPVGIGFNRRFDPHNADFRNRIHAGEIGSVEQLHITSRDPAPASKAYLEGSGGIFRDMTIHDFDMARFIIGEVVEVSARGFNQFSRDIKDLGDFDSTAIAMRTSREQSVLISNSRRAVYGFDQRIEALGSEGMLRVENVTDTEVRLYSSQSVEARSPYQNFFLERHLESFRREILEFVKLINGESADCPTFDDGRMALVLANAATESATTGRVVKVELD